jgi:DNA-binding FadR family transcriptional regulator
VTAAELDRTRPRGLPRQIADDLRSCIVAGTLREGDFLGHESDLIARYGVSRPSVREALRILEVEGLITVVRGLGGGIAVHTPDERHTARTAAMVLQARHVSLSDVFDARTFVEPIAARTIASTRRRSAAVRELNELSEREELALDDLERFGAENAAFHVRLVSLVGNQTLSIIAEMLNAVLSRAVADEHDRTVTLGSVPVRRRGIRSQRRLVELVDCGDGRAAEQHWREHMRVVGNVLLGHRAESYVDLQDHLEAFKT